jgi:hypothetical protein
VEAVRLYLDRGTLATPVQDLLALLETAEARWCGVRSYRATLHRRERRDGKLQPEETISFRFLRDHCVRLEWLDGSNRGKKALFVRGQYGDQVNLQIMVFFAIRVQRDPLDPHVLGANLHPITETGLGCTLTRLRRLLEVHGPTGQLAVTGWTVRPPEDERPGTEVTFTYPYTPDVTHTMTVRFDPGTSLPVLLELRDPQGLIERQRLDQLVLDPVLPAGAPELTVWDFYRSQVFPDDRNWSAQRETWTFPDVAPEFLQRQAAPSR